MVELPDASVHGEREREVVEVGHLFAVEHGQVGPEWAEAAVALALEELHLRELHVARGHVVRDDGAEDVLVKVVSGDLDRAGDRLAKDERQLDLVVEQPDVRGAPDLPAGAVDRSVGFLEEHVEAFLVRVEPGLDHVPPVVGALADEPGWRGHGRERLDIGHLERRRARAGGLPIAFATLDERGGGRIVALERRDPVRQSHAPACISIVEIADQVRRHCFLIPVAAAGTAGLPRAAVSASTSS